MFITRKNGTCLQEDIVLTKDKQDQTQVILDYIHNKQC